MRVFLDFEASSLSDDSYPIEVGWIDEGGVGESHLIRPAPGWSDWDPSAEAIHGVPRETLLAEGEPHDEVARRMLARLAGVEIHATAPSWDGKWLSLLLRAAGLPRHALRLTHSLEAHLAAAREILSGATPDAELDEAAAAVVVQAQANRADRPVRHRALDDARQELELWREVRRIAAAQVG
jgi:hypothetical protein